MATNPLPQGGHEIEYPSGDGKPVAETEIHFDCLAGLAEALRDWYEPDENVYVGSNLFVYYRQGSRRSVVAPDVFVSLRVPRLPPRTTYQTWREGKGPDLVVEITSPQTRDEDQLDKFEVYRDELRVREYVLFDPNAEYLDPSLQGYRLENGRYVPIEPSCGRLHSEVLGLGLIRSGRMLRLSHRRSDLRSPGTAPDRDRGTP
jgi:Uma2 family endonuclease